MTRSRYSTNESINRILRALQGEPLTADTPNVIPGEVLSEDAALSDIAELLEGSLPGETPTIPSGFTVSYASLPFASVVQANATPTEAVNTVILSPASHHWAHEFGGIYINTGSATQSFTANTWAKLTGSFQGYMTDSGAEINSDWNDDRIIVYDKGDYFVSYNICLYTDGAAGSYVDAEIYLSGTPALSTRSRATWHTTGSYITLSAGAHVDIPVSGYYVDLRLRPSASLVIRADAGQLQVQRSVG